MHVFVSVCLSVLEGLGKGGGMGIPVFARL